VSYTLRAFNESVYRSRKLNLAAYFYARIKDASDIIDNDGQAMKVIAEIWVKHKLPTEGPFTPGR